MTQTEGTTSGPSWPTPEGGSPPRGSEGPERDAPAATRPPMATWDRIKFLAGLTALWWILVWAITVNNPIEPVGDAVQHQLGSLWWLDALIALELARQLHYLASERSPRWHRFWTERVLGGYSRRSGSLDDWTRYRIGRVVRWLALLVVLAIVLGAFFHTSPATSLFQLPAAVFSAAPFILQLAFAFFFIAFQFIGLFWLLSRGGVDVYFPGDIKTRFADVWGQDAVLERVKENIIFLKDPEAIEAKGGYVPTGILLWGPPGTGKTLMAEAVAGETRNPFVFVDPGAFINMFFGVGILKVKSLFRKLRKLAVRYGGVVVFFDEADSLGARGALAQPGGFGGQMTGAPFSSATCNGLSWLDPTTTSLLLRTATSDESAQDAVAGRRQRFVAGAGMGGGGGGMGTLQALLTELSGLKKPRGFFNRVVRRALGLQPKAPPKYRILVMMATNMPEALDEALLRPGRIDRIYKVGYPSKAGRIRTYEGYLAKVRHQLTPEQVDRLATITPYATGATIKDLVNEALINAIRDGRDEIKWQDVVRAKQLKELGPPEDVEYIERERHAVAVHEACHAVAAARVRHHLTIDIATIEKGGTYLGMVASIPPEDQFTRWRSEYEADIVVSLASLVGERMFFEGDNSSGVSGDLEAATMVATLMEGYWGMGTTFASHGVTHRVGVGGGGKPGKVEGKKGERDPLPGELGERIESKLEELSRRARDLLDDNRTMVLALAHALETNKTVTGEDVMAIIDGRPGPLLDGRMYRDPAFVAEAEAYHARVVSAHRSHRGVDVPLPSLPPGIVTDSDGSTPRVSAAEPAESSDGPPRPANGDGPASG
jgi:cell division protease FtsH